MIRVGIAGWSYPDWEGPVYPRPRGPGFHPLAFLAPFVDVVELNSTFYGLPDRAHVQRWARLAEGNPRLVFTAKLHRDLTHEGWSPARRAFLEESRARLEPLEAAGRLHALLAQLPLRFVHGPQGEAHLRALAQALAPTPWSVELRHRSWAQPAAQEFLRGLGASLVHLDWPAAPEHLPDSPSPAMPQIGPLGYLRLHGRNARAWFDPRAGRDDRYDHRYGAQELEGIEQRVRRIAARVESTLVVANNHYGGKAVAAALELKARLSGGPVPAPDTLVEAFPDLGPWVSLRGQGRLF